MASGWALWAGFRVRIGVGTWTGTHTHTSACSLTALHKQGLAWVVCGAGYLTRLLSQAPVLVANSCAEGWASAFHQVALARTSSRVGNGLACCTVSGRLSALCGRWGMLYLGHLLMDFPRRARGQPKKKKKRSLGSYYTAGVQRKRAAAEEVGQRHDRYWGVGGLAVVVLK